MCGALCANERGLRSANYWTRFALNMLNENRLIGVREWHGGNSRVWVWRISISQIFSHSFAYHMHILVWVNGLFMYSASLYLSCVFLLLLLIVSSLSEEKKQWYMVFMCNLLSACARRAVRLAYSLFEQHFGCFIGARTSQCIVSMIQRGRVTEFSISWLLSNCIIFDRILVIQTREIHDQLLFIVKHVITFAQTPHRNRKE